MPMLSNSKRTGGPSATPSSEPVNAPQQAPKPAAAPTTRATDQGEFNGGVTAAGLNPLVPAALQKATWDRVMALGEEIANQGKIPVIMIDHRLSGLDDRPIIRKGFEKLVAQIPELKDIDAALKNGTLKCLPGYTEQASDAWRDLHPELVQKYPAVFGARGTRVNIGFMSYPVSDANATAGLLELEKAFKLRTGGKGRLVFAGAGTGTADMFKSVYERPVAQGGAGLENVDIRFGSPAPSAEANARAAELAAAYEAKHPGERVPLDQDSRGKAGWIETVERELRNGEEQVVIAFADDRLHNRVGAQAAGKLGENMIDIRLAAPGISVAKSDAANENQASTFHPNPS